MTGSIERHIIDLLAGAGGTLDTDEPTNRLNFEADSRIWMMPSKDSRPTGQSPTADAIRDISCSTTTARSAAIS
jgi:hypothetical protein